MSNNGWLLKAHSYTSFADVSGSRTSQDEKEICNKQNIVPGADKLRTATAQPYAHCTKCSTSVEPWLSTVEIIIINNPVYNATETRKEEWA